MAPRSKRNKPDGLDAYWRIRKPLPPAESAEGNRRRAIAKEQADEEADEALNRGRRSR